MLTAQSTLFADAPRETVPLVGLETMDEQELWNLLYRVRYNGRSTWIMPAWPACEIMTAIQRRGSVDEQF